MSGGAIYEGHLGDHMSMPESGQPAVQSRTNHTPWRRRAAMVAAGAAIVTTACGAVHIGSAADAAIAQKTTAPSGKLPGMFLIGTWEQPVNPRTILPNDVLGSNNFAYWKSLGINTLVEIPQVGFTAQQYVAWDQAAASAGLWTMRRPFNDNPAVDHGGSTSIAWNLPDEPDKVLAPAHKTPAEIKQDAANDKAANPSRPTYLSLVGGALAYGWTCSSTNKIACNGGAYAPYANWLSVDDYPFDANHKSTTGAKNYISMIGQEMDALWKVGSASAVRMAFIETGHIGSTKNPTVTAAAMKAEIWEAVVHGARGIVYFSDTTPGGQTNTQGQVVTPATTYNNTATSKGAQPGIPSMMKQQNSWLKSLQSVLAGTINPTGISISVPGPLDAGWRKTSTGLKYFFVVNTSNSYVTKTFRFNGVGGNKGASVYNESRSIHLNGSGYATDSFKPYAVHIYVVR